MNMSGTSHITLRGLGIHHSRGNGLLADNVTNVHIENCEISGHGQHGVSPITLGSIYFPAQPVSISSS
jgi:hypothetical protein